MDKSEIVIILSKKLATLIILDSPIVNLEKMMIVFFLLHPPSSPLTLNPSKRGKKYHFLVYVCVSHMCMHMSMCVFPSKVNRKSSSLFCWEVSALLHSVIMHIASNQIENGLSVEEYILVILWDNSLK